MKRRYSHIVYTCLAVVILASCNPHYPDKNFEGSLGYVADDLRVPMLLAVNDSSLYGMGAFGGDGMSTDSIYVYAFYTPSPEVKGAPGKVDYRERMDAQDDEAIYCLVDDADSIGHGKRACLSSSTSFLHWADNDVIMEVILSIAISFLPTIWMVPLIWAMRMHFTEIQPLCTTISRLMERKTWCVATLN